MVAHRCSRTPAYQVERSVKSGTSAGRVSASQATTRRSDREWVHKNAAVREATQRRQRLRSNSGKLQVIAAQLQCCAARPGCYPGWLVQRSCRSLRRPTNEEGLARLRNGERNRV